jgi:hypothetical protein
MGTKNSESRQVKALAFSILKWIIIRNFLCEQSRVTGNDVVVKDKKIAQSMRVSALWSCFRSAKLIAEQWA